MPHAPRSVADEAADPSTPPERLLEIARGVDGEALIAVASNPNLPFEGMAMLVGDLPSEVESNPSLLFADLTGASTPEEEEALAIIHRTLAATTSSIERLERYATSSNASWRLAVAKNHHTPADILARLANDPVAPVRIDVASHPSLPQPLLTRLLSSQESTVQRAAWRNPSLPQATLAHALAQGTPPLVELLAGNPSLTTAMLVDIYQRFPRAHLTVLEHPNVPLSVLRHVVGTGKPPSEDNQAYEEWLTFATANPSLPTALLKKVSSWEGAVRENVAAHPNTPVSVLTEYAGDSAESVRALVAFNPSTPASVLRRLSHDPEDDVRQGVADNEAAEDEVLEALRADAAVDVRECATITLRRKRIAAAKAR